MKSAIAGGRAISNYKPGMAEIKNDRDVGYHAIVTDADFRSQDAILKELNKYDQDSMLITEEHVKDRGFEKRLIKTSALDKLKDSKVYIIDELDGTSSQGIGHPEWSTSVGYVDKMVHKTGAVFAPQINNGTLFFASRNGGAFIRTDSTQEIHVSRTAALSDAYIIFGVDNFLKKYTVHNKLLIEVGDVARTTNSNGSCALALGYVAAGMSDALVQPLQFPWDWAAGKVLVEEAGGKLIFYEMENGKIEPIDKLKPKHYNPDKRTVGFVAGNEKMTDSIMNMLLSIK